MDSIHSFGNGCNVYWRKKVDPGYIAALLMRESDTLRDGTVYLEAWSFRNPKGLWASSVNELAVG